MHIITKVLMPIDFLFQFQGAIITIVKPSKLHTQPKCVCGMHLASWSIMIWFFFWTTTKWNPVDPSNPSSGMNIELSRDALVDIIRAEYLLTVHCRVLCAASSVLWSAWAEEILRCLDPCSVGLLGRNKQAYPDWLPLRRCCSFWKCRRLLAVLVL